MVKFRLIFITFFLIIFGTLIFAFFNHKSINICDDIKTKRGIADYFDISNEISILKKEFNNDECFILFRDNNEAIKLAIFEKTYLSFGKYYRMVGGASNSSGRFGDFNMTQSANNEEDLLLVAFGETKYLENRSYRVIVNGKTYIEKIPDKEPFFLNVYRYRDDYSAYGYISFDWDEVI